MFYQIIFWILIGCVIGFALGAHAVVAIFSYAMRKGEAAIKRGGKWYPPNVKIGCGDCGKRENGE